MYMDIYSVISFKASSTIIDALRHSLGQTHDFRCSRKGAAQIRGHEQELLKINIWMRQMDHIQLLGHRG